MPLLFDNASRDALRQVYVDAWRKHREGVPLEPLEAQVADVVALHPEYHALLEYDDQALDRDFTPESGEGNPFLHMGLHLAVREQIATDRPAGIREIFANLERRFGSAHDAEHRMIEQLAEALWNAHRSGRPPDEEAYLDALRRLR